MPQRAVALKATVSDQFHHPGGRGQTLAAQAPNAKPNRPLQTPGAVQFPIDSVMRPLVRSTTIYARGGPDSGAQGGVHLE
jgi:hypothetical protein